MGMFLPLIGAGISAFSSFQAGKEAKKTNQLNQQIADRNYEVENQARLDAIAEANRQRDDAHLGETDAAGNRRYWVEGKGWVTDLSQSQQQLQTGTEQELLRQLVTEAQRNEKVNSDAASRRGREGILASGAENEYRLARRPDASALRDYYLAAGATARNQQADRAGDLAARQNVRSGARNVADVEQGIRATADADSAAQQGMEAARMGTEAADTQYANTRNNANTLYDYFRRASTTGATAPNGYQPTGPQGQSTGSADQALLNLTAKAPQQEYTSADYSGTDTMADLGKTLMGYFGAQQGQQQGNAITDRWGKNVGGI